MPLLLKLCFGNGTTSCKKTWLISNLFLNSLLVSGASTLIFCRDIIFCMKWICFFFQNSNAEACHQKLLPLRHTHTHANGLSWMWISYANWFYRFLDRICIHYQTPAAGGDEMGQSNENPALFLTNQEGEAQFFLKSKRIHTKKITKNIYNWYEKLHSSPILPPLAIYACGLCVPISCYIFSITCDWNKIILFWHIIVLLWT